MIYFKVNIEPYGKGRPRITIIGGRPHAYTPEKTREYEQIIRSAFKKTKQQGYFNGEALCVDCLFEFGVPKSYTKKDTKLCLSGEKDHTKKPDIDNCIKSVLDALQGNGGAFADDTQIVSISATKKYADSPAVIIKIWDKGEK